MQDWAFSWGLSPAEGCSLTVAQVSSFSYTPANRKPRSSSSSFGFLEVSPSQGVARPQSTLLTALMTYCFITQHPPLDLCELLGMQINFVWYCCGRLSGWKEVSALVGACLCACSHGSLCVCVRTVGACIHFTMRSFYFSHAVVICAFDIKVLLELET